MKPFNEQDLIAYHLQELSPRRARALERALETDPALAAESAAYAAMLRSFKPGASVPADPELLARNWHALRPSLTAHSVPPAAPLRWRLPMLAGASLAFAATALFVTTRHPHSPAQPPRNAAITQPASPASSAPPPATLPPATTLTTQKLAELRRENPDRHPTATPLPPHSATSSTVQPPTPPLEASLPPAARTSPTPPTRTPAAEPDRPLAADPGALALAAPGSVNGSSRKHPSPHHQPHPADLLLAMGGTFIGTRTVAASGDESLSQGATHAVLALAAIHQQFHPALGYRVSVSYTRPGFQFSSRTANISGGQTEINSRIYQLATTWVVQGPHSGRFSTSAEAGAALMAFLPTQQSPDTSSRLRAAGVLGIAAEYALSKHLAVHAAYQAVVFRGPGFNLTGSPLVPVATTTLVSQQPILGITYHFAHK